MGATEIRRSSAPGLFLCEMPISEGFPVLLVSAGSLGIAGSLPSATQLMCSQRLRDGQTSDPNSRENTPEETNSTRQQNAQSDCLRADAQRIDQLRVVADRVANCTDSAPAKAEIGNRDTHG